MVTDAVTLTDVELAQAIANKLAEHERLKFEHPKLSRVAWHEYLALVHEQMERKGRKAA